MKLLPELFNETFNNVFDDAFFTHNTNVMKTDIHEKDGNYVLSIEVAGYQKEDIQMELKNGYLNIQATKNDHHEDQDDHGNIVRQERYHGTSSRSFYLGEGIREEDIKANLENGELLITFPKEAKEENLQSHFIPIE